MEGIPPLTKLRTKPRVFDVARTIAANQHSRAERLRALPDALLTTGQLNLWRWGARSGETSPPVSTTAAIQLQGQPVYRSPASILDPQRPTYFFKSAAIKNTQQEGESIADTLLLRRRTANQTSPQSTSRHSDGQLHIDVRLSSRPAARADCLLQQPLNVGVGRAIGPQRPYLCQRLPSFNIHLPYNPAQWPPMAAPQRPPVSIPISQTWSSMPRDPRQPPECARS